MWQLRAPSAAPAAPRNHTEIGGRQAAGMGEQRTPAAARPGSSSVQSDRQRTKQQPPWELPRRMDGLAWQADRSKQPSSRRPAPADPLFRIDSETDRRVAVAHPFPLSRLWGSCSSASGKGRCACRVCARARSAAINMYKPAPIRINMDDGWNSTARCAWPAIFFTFFLVFLLVVMIRRPDLSWSL